MNTDQLRDFIVERYRIHHRRDRGQPKPWTADPILQEYRFCNVYRELDYTTQWIRQCWQPYVLDSNEWFLMLAARLINYVPTLAKLTPAMLGQASFAAGKAVTWNPEEFVSVLQKLEAGTDKVYSSAYITVTPLYRKGQPKSEYFARSVLQPAWDLRETVLNQDCTWRTLQDCYSSLRKLPAVGSFLAAQIVADLKYTSLRGTPDWHSFCASGMGSKRGMNRILGLPPSNALSEKNFLYYMAVLEGKLQPRLARAGLPEMHYQDIQNCLCEFDKYERLRNGESRVRNRFNGAEDESD